MSVWLIEPLDPLIARDGRPSAVGHFRTTSFPFPSMIAGAARTRMGSENGAFVLRGKEALDELKQKAIVHGPLLAELEPDGDEVLRWLAPSPRDSLFLQEGEALPRLKRLLPRSLRPGEAMDSLPKAGLLPVGSQGEETYGKPPQRLPVFWNWNEFQGWLEAPADRPEVNLESLGVGDLPVETRAHLAIQPGERVGIDGMLFQTSGLRFLQKRSQASPDCLDVRRFALSLSCQEAAVAGRPLALRHEIAPLGGERRLARWSPASLEWPRLPEMVRESIVETGRARLILLTPAVFERGSLPGWSGGAWPLGGDLQASVQAACVARPSIVSGWDLAADNGSGKAKGRPKPTRRLAPMGSVYFLELTGNPDDRRRWCEETWFACVSDDEQDRRDGFGMAALGVWGKEAP